MVANPENFKMFLGSTTVLENWRMKSSNEVKLLGITIDNGRTFQKHLNNFCNMTTKRLRDLTRTSKFLSQEQVKHLSETYNMSTFNYCPLIWLFCGKTQNNSIKKIRILSLWLIYETEAEDFENLLEKDESKSVHESNINSP